VEGGSEAVETESASTASTSTLSAREGTGGVGATDGETVFAAEAPARRRSNSSIRPFFFRRRRPRAPHRRGRRAP
jgi:hypothetical protein